MHDFLALFAQPETYVSLLTLTAMEIVLGIDNIVFISIVAGQLPRENQAKARTLGLVLALGFRIGLLFFITAIAGLVHPIFTVDSFALSGRDLVLLAGGIFLLCKSTVEIHSKIEGEEHDPAARTYSTFWNVVGQIIMLDIVFSFDSIITAVGLVQHVSIMILAVVISLVVMIIFSGSVSTFIEKHPTIKMLALSFLLMIGTMLIAEGLHFHIPRGYVYFAMAFSLGVEMLNLKVRARHKARAG